MEPKICLFFAGNCLEAISHCVDVLGGQIEFVFRNGDAPDAQSRMPGGDDLVMNMTMRIGSTVIMASNCPSEWYSEPQGMRVQLAP